MFWIGLVIGMFVGATIGLLIAGLCIAARRGEEQGLAELADREKRPT